MKNKALAIFGTASNVGKSTVVAAIARYFANQGYEVAPFKALNISLNAGVSHENLEMARSQITQAHACYKKPSVLMNPILLKPEANQQMQLIVNGKVVEHLKKESADAYQGVLQAKIKQAYFKLAKHNDLVIVEGSGSCCELNLKHKDLANFAFAESINVPTLLVANVENCGVFASVYGTLQLLSEKQRNLVKGIIINKYQGDVSYFDEAKTILEQITLKPILGVLPMHQLNLDEEDGLYQFAGDQIKENKLDVVIIKLPYMSNMNDFQPLHDFEMVNVRYITRKERIQTCDLLIIPGSKDTLHDLQFLKDQGLFQDIQQLAKQGVLIIGICGGYQMLGQSIKDDCLDKSKLEIANGLGLLQVETILTTQKQTLNTDAYFIKDTFLSQKQTEVKGYEIHCGQTHLNDESETWIKSEHRILGAHNANIYGTYLHGLFENEAFTNKLVNHLLSQKDLEPIEIKLLSQHQKLEELAIYFAKYCDMAKIEKIIKEG